MLLLFDIAKVVKIILTCKVLTEKDIIFNTFIVING